MNLQLDALILEGNDSATVDATLKILQDPGLPLEARFFAESFLIEAYWFNSDYSSVCAQIEKVKSLADAYGVPISMAANALSNTFANACAQIAFYGPDPTLLILARRCDELVGHINFDPYTDWRALISHAALDVTYGRNQAAAEYLKSAAAMAVVPTAARRGGGVHDLVELITAKHGARTKAKDGPLFHVTDWAKGSIGPRYVGFRLTVDSRLDEPLVTSANALGSFVFSGSDRRSDTLLGFYGFVERWARVL